MIGQIQPNERKLTKFQTFKAAITERQISALILLLFLSFGIFIGITVLSTYMHERVHGAINNQYGMESTYGWEFNGLMITAFTKAIIPANHTYGELCNETCSMLHVQNEIVTYNLEALTNLILALFVIWGTFYHIHWFDPEIFAKHIDDVTEKKWKKKELKRLKREYKQLLKERKKLDLG